MRIRAAGSSIVSIFGFVLNAARSWLRRCFGTLRDLLLTVLTILYELPTCGDLFLDFECERLLDRDVLFDLAMLTIILPCFFYLDERILLLVSVM